MYSLLPAAVSILFLNYGVYALVVKGFTRVTLSFFALCVTTFLWKFSWAVLFQMRDPEIAGFIVKFGYFVILFLPTTLYQFLTELNDRAQERTLVYFSYTARLPGHP